MTAEPRTCGLVIHVPHASRGIPGDVRSGVMLTDDELERELVSMTDAYTDELFAFDQVEMVVFPVSRLVVDPERFERDEDEPMASRGMGVIYTRTSHGDALRPPPSGAEREQLLERYYRPHHARLTAAVDRALTLGACLIIDAHSFPSRALPYELDQRLDRPDICIGTDPIHTPGWLREAARAAAQAAGWSVEIDRPFSGSLVPQAHYRRDRRVASVMIEVNRRLYMEERAGARSGGFGATSAAVQQMISALWQQVQTHV